MVTAKRSRDRFPTDHCAGVPGRDPNQQHAESDLEHGGWRGVSVAIHFRLEFDQLDQPGQPRHGSRCDAQHDRLRHERPATVLPAGGRAVRIRQKGTKKTKKRWNVQELRRCSHACSTWQVVVQRFKCVWLDAAETPVFLNGQFSVTDSLSAAKFYRPRY